ncbi:MAG: prolyl oligopeptidase family serine peptidase [Chlorobia bacterium]|nr:prolyl oligopeptidase family serine peptidase [Fimbriimonadaceae bacterium]
MIALAAFLILSAPQNQEITTYTVDGVSRQATIYAPSVKTAKPPLVFGFHGHGGNMRNAARSFQMHELWPEAVVVYLQGLPTVGRLSDPKGEKNGWQHKAGDNGDRDLKFFDAVYARMIREFKADPNRVYAMGHSNGGAFSYLLWAQRGDFFAAFGPSGAVASAYRGQLKPKPAFIVMGEEDQLVRPIAQTMGIRYVKNLNGVDGDTKMGTLKGTKADLGLYIYPGNHTYPKEANKPMVEFFKEHARS